MHSLLAAVTAACVLCSLHSLLFVFSACCSHCCLCSLPAAVAVVLPRLCEDQLASLEQWARNSCALYAMMRDDRGRMVLLLLDTRPRTAASFAQTLRSVYRNRGIDTCSLHVVGAGGNLRIKRLGHLGWVWPGGALHIEHLGHLGWAWPGGALHTKRLGHLG